ncbi:hypothetical protein NIES4101_47650 [Calothrix sp. NIES-4101]|nr:hypothetical protein NIES4101_47650 [Calothrix sp. NIES-4101]
MPQLGFIEVAHYKLGEQQAAITDVKILAANSKSPGAVVDAENILNSQETIICLLHSFVNYSIWLLLVAFH